MLSESKTSINGQSSEAVLSSGGRQQHQPGKFMSDFLRKTSELAGSLSPMLSSPHVFSNEPTWMLGQSYSQLGRSSPGEAEEKHDSEARVRNLRDFLSDFYSRIWISYRRNFAPIGNSSYTSDTGWGCMLRSGQMILAQALQIHFLGRKWRYQPEGRETLEYAQLLRWFVDDPNPATCPFSLHNILRDSANRIGQWFGPHAASVLLARSLDRHSGLDGMCMVVGEHGALYLDTVIEKCSRPAPPSEDSAPGSARAREAKTGQTGQRWRAVCILIPVRLGENELNPDYIPGLLQCYRIPSCLGLVGGRPRSSLYFVAAQGQRLLYLDPHSTQVAAPLAQDFCKNSTSFHCKSVLSMPINSIDPSLAVGFYCRTRADFDSFVASAREIAALPSAPFFIADKAPSYDGCDFGDDSNSKDESDNSDGDFVLL